MVPDTLRAAAAKLRLSGLLRSLGPRLQEAAGNNLAHAEFLELVFGDEIAVRAQRAVERGKKRAAFRELRTLEDFDFTFNKSIKRQQIYDLATCRFIAEARDLLFIGPPGVGKSHIVQALGYQAVKNGHRVLYTSVFDLVRDLLHEEDVPGEKSALTKYLRCELLIIDDMGIKQLPARSGEYLFEIIMRRYEKRSTVMTSNRPIEEWGKLIGDVPSATAILDRFLHHAEIVQITGKSYRMASRQKERTAPAAPETKKPATCPKPAIPTPGASATARSSGHATGRCSEAVFEKNSSSFTHKNDPMHHNLSGGF
jgi:DNA replication protein DnaC